MKNDSKIVHCAKNNFAIDPTVSSRIIIQAINGPTARLDGVLRGGLGSENRGRPLKPLEEHVGKLPRRPTFPAPHFINKFFTQCNSPVFHFHFK